MWHVMARLVDFEAGMRPSTEALEIDLRLGQALADGTERDAVFPASRERIAEQSRKSADKGAVAVDDRDDGDDKPDSLIGGHLPSSASRAMTEHEHHENEQPDETRESPLSSSFSEPDQEKNSTRPSEPRQQGELDPALARPVRREFARVAMEEEQTLGEKETAGHGPELFQRSR